MLRHLGFVLIFCIIVLTSISPATPQTTEFDVYTQYFKIEQLALNITYSEQNTEQGLTQIWETELKFRSYEEVLIPGDPIILEDTGCGLIDSDIVWNGFAKVDYRKDSLECHQSEGYYSVSGRNMEIYDWRLYNYSYSPIVPEDINGTIQLTPLINAVEETVTIEINTAEIRILNNTVNNISYDESQLDWNQYQSGEVVTTVPSNLAPTDFQLLIIATLIGLSSVIRKKKRNSRNQRK